MTTPSSSRRSSARPRVAFLGPSGTHSEFALLSAAPESERLPCLTIAEIFERTAAGEVDFGFAPLENKLHGPVTETLDLLITHKDAVRIDRCVLATIRNGLGMLPAGGAASPDTRRPIREIFSHEQALRQCAAELARRAPDAALIPMASTGSAIAHVKERGLTDVAVVAPPDTLRAHGFDILSENISDLTDNRTRFAFLKKGAVRLDRPYDLQSDAQGSQLVTSIVVIPGRDRQGLLFEILNVVSVRHGINLLSIHSRPDRRGGFVFHLDLEGHLAEERLQRCFHELEQYCIDATGRTVEIGIFGSYRREPFEPAGFQHIAVIGGSGVMGRWFGQFFRSVGLEVHSYDVDAQQELEQVVRASQVVLLSVPMGAVEPVVEKIIPFLSAGQLVVENCSIKRSALPFMEQLPEGVETLGFHTMFGPGVDSLRGQNVVVTKTERSGTLAAAFESLFYKYGARISYATADEHDQRVSLTQAAVQSLLIAFAAALGKSVGSLDELEALGTPNFRLLLEAAERVLSQNDELTIDLQARNSFATKSRHELLEALFDLVTSLDRGEEESLRTLVETGRRLFEK